jgi:hypothetical protein
VPKKVLDDKFVIGDRVRHTEPLQSADQPGSLPSPTGRTAPRFKNMGFASITPLRPVLKVISANQAPHPVNPVSASPDRSLVIHHKKFTR